MSSPPRPVVPSPEDLLAALDPTPALDGGPPEQLTHLEGGRVRSHAWSPDGRWLYLVREETTSDAVLIRGF